MMRGLDALLRGLSAMAVAVALAVGVTACGGSDDGDGGATAADRSGSDAGVADDEREVAATMRRLREVYNDSNGRAFCAELSKDGKREIAAVARSGEYSEVIKSRDCPGIIADYSRAIVEAGMEQQPVEVRRVTVDGDKARIVIKGGLAGLRSIVPFRFVQEDGQWKLVDPISGTHNTIRVETD